jgi:hypothetical protein
MTPDDQVLRVLYVTHSETGNDAAILAGLTATKPCLQGNARSRRFGGAG